MEKKTIYITDFIEWNRVRAGYPPSKESKAIDVRLLEQKREEEEAKV